MDEHTSGLPEPLSRLMEELTKLPGIGSRSAERIAFHLLRVSKEEALKLAGTINEIKSNLKHCSTCYNLTEKDPCTICRDPRRDRSLIVVVEQPKDVMLLEQTGLINGLYHVLMGHIAPLEGIEPGDLTINALLERAGNGRPIQRWRGTGRPFTFTVY